MLKKLSIIILMLILSKMAFAGIAEEIANMKPGEWYEIPNSKLSESGVLPEPFPPGYTGLKSVIIAWSGGVYDTKSNRLLIWGGGHADYSGNEIYAFDMDTFTWSRIWGPTPNEQIPMEADYYETYADGNPSSRHTYHGLAYIPEVDSLWSNGGSCWRTGAYSKSKWIFDLESLEWENTGISSNCDSGTALDPVTGNIFCRDTYSVREHDYSKNTVIERHKIDGGWWSKTSAEIDPNSRKMLFLGKGNAAVFDLDTHDFSKFSRDDLEGDTEIMDANAPGLAYCPDIEKFVAWSGDPSNPEILPQNVYLIDPLSLVFEKRQPAASNNIIPTNSAENGTYGRFRYVRSSGIFIVVNSIYENVYAYKISSTSTSSPPVDRSDVLQTFTLTSSETNTDTPFTIGLGFEKGDTTAPTLNIDNYQIEIKKRWNDGSVKHAIASGRTSLTAGTPKTIDVYAEGAQPQGSDLTSSDIESAMPEASIALSNIGTVNLVDLLASPDRIFISGPEMVEAHYSADFPDTDLVAKFHVRLYANGNIWIRAIVENGILDGTGGTNKSYTPTVIIGNATIYKNGDAELSHFGYTRWAVDGWIGTSDPGTAIAQDCDYLEESGLVPNYWKENPDIAALDGLKQTYIPMQKGDWTEYMGATGYQSQIGLLPKWDALYINSNGNSKAYNSVIANAKSLNSYPIVWRDPATDSPIALSQWGTWTIDGPDGGGATNCTAGPLTWDVAHHGSGGYLAYLITGDYYYLETMEYQSALIYLVIRSSAGSGTSRLLRPVQTRGVAWANRTIGQLAAIAPSDAIVNDFIAFLSNGIDYWHSVIETPGMNDIGYFYTYSAYPGFAYGDGQDAPWMQHFWAQALGYVSDLEPFEDMTNWNAVRDRLYTAVVGILGPNGSGSYCFTKASNYKIKVSPVDDRNPTLWYDSWGDVYEGTFGTPNTSCGNTIEGSYGGAPSAAATGYWGNLLPAIAYAVEDGATGGSDAWARLTGATNWSMIENAGFDDNPIWGIVPRSEPNTGDDVLPPPANLRLIIPKVN